MSRINTSLTFQQLETLCKSSSAPKGNVARRRGMEAPYWCKRNGYIFYSDFLAHCQKQKEPGEGCECVTESP